MEKNTDQLWSKWEALVDEINSQDTSQGLIKRCCREFECEMLNLGLKPEPDWVQDLKDGKRVVLKHEDDEYSAIMKTVNGECFAVQVLTATWQVSVNSDMSPICNVKDYYDWEHVVSF